MERQAPRQARPVQEPTHEFQTPGHRGEPGHTEPVHSRGTHHGVKVCFSECGPGVLNEPAPTGTAFVKFCVIPVS